MKIALTGGIGSGKSLACELFTQRGFNIISMDIISKNILDYGSNAYYETVSTFGNEILNDDDTINRAKLKDIIFNDIDKKTALENIIHPAVRLEESDLRKKLSRKEPKKPFITESALLIETGYYKDYDLLMAVYASRDTRIARVLQRDDIDIELLENIMKSQVSETEYINYAKVIIDNDSDIDNLNSEVERVSNMIHQLIYAGAF